MFSSSGFDSVKMNIARQTYLVCLPDTICSILPCEKCTDLASSKLFMFALKSTCIWCLIHVPVIMLVALGIAGNNLASRQNMKVVKSEVKFWNNFSKTILSADVHFNFRKFSCMFNRRMELVSFFSKDKNPWKVDRRLKEKFYSIVPFAYNRYRS